MIEQAVRRRPRLRGILAQKPLALNLPEARRVVEMCAKGGIPLAVNQNMRYDQSMRALKTLLTRGELGEPVLETIEMRAIPHWQSWLRDYGRLTLLNMSIHLLDCFRYLFGEPRSVYASMRSDPRTTFEHRDGIALYILEYDHGLRASALGRRVQRPVPGRVCRRRLRMGHDAISYALIARQRLRVNCSPLAESQRAEAEE